MNLADLHVHPSLPWIGSAWRRLQGFRPAALEGAPIAPRPFRSFRSFRLYGAACYETYLLRPDAARNRLFASLASFRGRLEAAGVRTLLSAADLEPLRTVAERAPDGSEAKWPEEGERAGEAFFLAVESMRCLRDPRDVRRLWDLGVRSLQPIHFLDTSWGGSSREGLLPESRLGLSGSGRALLAEMGRLGMILDVAHMSHRNAEQCLAAYDGPVMCSHTGFQGLKAGARNLPADLAREIFRRGGLVGVTCWRHLLGKDPGKEAAKAPPRNARAAWTRSYCATAAAFAVLVPAGGAAPGAGVAVGSDRGAPIRAPAWFYSPGHLAEMAACLAGHGWTPAQVRGFFSGNALDFLFRALPA